MLLVSKICISRYKLRILYSSYMACGISFGLVPNTWSFEVESLLCTSISDQRVTFPLGAHLYTHIDTHAHYMCTYTYTYAHTLNTHALNTCAHTLACLHVLQHHSLVYNKMVVRMATARRRTTANRTALSAVTTGVSVLSEQDPLAFGWVGLACQPTPCHWRQVN